MADFLSALDEVQPAFGSNTESLELSRRHGIIDYGDAFKHLQSTLRTLVAQVKGGGCGLGPGGREGGVGARGRPMGGSGRWRTAWQGGAGGGSAAAGGVRVHPETLCGHVRSFHMCSSPGSVRRTQPGSS
jgi:hypothetical protein